MSQSISWPLPCAPALSLSAGAAGLTWPSWRAFHLASSRVFDGRELCDCFRPEGPWDPATERRVEENRFLFVPGANISVSFLQARPWNPRTPSFFMFPDTLHPFIPEI